MPNCFQLTRKTAPEAGPVALQTIDEEICAAVGDAVHPIRYCRSWFDSIGWMIAVTGLDWAGIRKALTVPCALDRDPTDCTKHAHSHKNECLDDRDFCTVHGGTARPPDRSCSRAWPEDPAYAQHSVVPVLDYLEANFTSDAFVEIGRRS